jgi:hypothetical protein
MRPSVRIFTAMIAGIMRHLIPFRAVQTGAQLL